TGAATDSASRVTTSRHYGARSPVAPAGVPPRTSAPTPGEGMLSWLNTCAFLLLVAVAAWLDVRAGRIPNLLTVGGLAAAFALRGLGGGDVKLLAAVGAFLGPERLVTALLAGGVAGGVLALAVALRRGVLLPALLGTGNVLAHWLTLGRAGERRTLASPGAITVPYGVAIAVGAVTGWFLSPLGGG